MQSVVSAVRILVMGEMQVLGGSNICGEPLGAVECCGLSLRSGCCIVGSLHTAMLVMKTVNLVSLLFIVLGVV